MRLHGNARLTPHGRTLMCRRVREEGWTVPRAAHAAGCSERTCYRWLARYDAGDSTHRADVLPTWLEYYNHRRPHSALGHKPPAIRLTNAD